ncbi:ataxin-7-like protein 1 isoform X2 [Rhinoraja longicauda]
MRLIREDMPIFGHCPAHDEFFLVVCNQCGQVVKPQAFQMHCERRHGSLNKLSARKSPALTSTNSILQKSRCNSVQTAVTSNHGIRSSKEKLHSPGNMVLQLDVPSKGPKENMCLFVPVVNLEKIPSLGKTESSCIKLTAKPPAVSPSSPEPISPSEKPSMALVFDSMPKTGAANAIPKAADLSFPALVIQNGKGERPPMLEEPVTNNRRNNHKVHRRIIEKESDLNKHCGVMDPETKKHCTRSLTCKMHSLTQRRNVLGRRLPFDELLAEHRASLKNKEGGRERKQQAKEAVPLSPVQQMTTGGWGSVTPGVPMRSTKPVCCSGSRVCLESELSDSERSTADPPAPHSELPHPLFRFEINSRLSSEESDGEMPEELEKPDCHYSQLHPKPLAFCTFGSRMISRGYYVFNRRLDRFRLALNSMVERHLNSQMWRKIPPAMDAQRAPPPPASSTHSLQSLPSLPVVANSSSLSLVGTDLKPTPSTAASAAARTSTELPAICCLSPPLIPPASNPLRASGRMSWAKAGRVSGFHQGSYPFTDASHSKRKKPAFSTSQLQPTLDPPLKRNCVLSLGSLSNPPPGGIVPRPANLNTSSHNANNGVAAHSPKALGQAGMVGHSGNSIKGTGWTVEHFDPKRDARLCEGRKLGIHCPSSPPLIANSPLPVEGRKRKNAASCLKPTKITKSPEVNCAHRKREAKMRP